MKVKSKTELKYRCDRSLGTSKGSIYRDTFLALNPHLKDGQTLLDLAAGTGAFKKYLTPRLPLLIEEADFQFSDGRTDFHTLDLNEPFDLKKDFDVVTVIEALHFFENPRHLLREAVRHLRPGGLLVVTVPNLHSLTSLLSLLFRGHHSAFSRADYPAHLTAIHRVDLKRMLQEVGLAEVSITPVSEGRIPGTSVHWQSLPAVGRLFHSPLFSDNLIFIARKP